MTKPGWSVFTFLKKDVFPSDKHYETMVVVKAFAMFIGAGAPTHLRVTMHLLVACCIDRRRQMQMLTAGGPLFTSSASSVVLMRNVGLSELMAM